MGKIQMDKIIELILLQGMCDGLEQRVYRRERDRRFLYRWSSHRSDSWSGRKRKSRKRALASYDSITEENHRHVAHVALKEREEGKGIEKQKNQSMLYSSRTVF